MTRRAPATRRPWKRYVLLTLVAVLGLVTWRAVSKLNAVPEWWEANRSFIERLETSEPETLRGLAAAVELRLPREFTRPVGDGDGRRTLAAGFDEVNAWLALKLGTLLKNQGVRIDGLAGAMVTERDGRLVAAVSQDLAGSFRVVSFFFDVTDAVNDAGQATGEPAFRLAEVRAGEQSVPLSLLARFADVDRIADPQIRAMVERAAAGESVGPLLLPVDAHRTARVKGFTINKSGVEADLEVTYRDR